MPLKRLPASKRAALPRAVDFTSTFKKDWERHNRAGRSDMRRLKEAMMLLTAADDPLVPQ